MKKITYKTISADSGIYSAGDYLATYVEVEGHREKATTSPILLRVRKTVYRDSRRWTAEVIIPSPWSIGEPTILQAYCGATRDAAVSNAVRAEVAR